MQIEDPPIFEPPPSEETPGSKMDCSKDTYTDKQMIRDLLKIVLSADFPSKGDISFKDEIAALRAALSHLQESFSQADTLDQQLKLTHAIHYLTSSLSRLVRTQEFLRKHQPSSTDEALERAIQDTLKEWGWI